MLSNKMLKVFLYAYISSRFLSSNRLFWKNTLPWYSKKNLSAFCALPVGCELPPYGLLLLCSCAT
uniref:Uncharacterized protein n=1 Tax=Rhizophora mucronata TaxID=61149 RepID=A0A2P2QFC8_RHIMU